MKQYRSLFIVLALASGSAARVHADGSMEFSLNEVEQPHGVPKAAEPRAAKSESGSPIEDALGELRWGMSKDDVLRVLKKRLQAEFQAEVKHERDIVRQDALYQEAKQRYERIKNGFVTFDGGKNGWDVSPIADEFRRGNGESMLVMEDASARNFYFFMHGKLWKWYRELKADGAEGGFDALRSMVREQFGSMHAEKTQRGEGEQAIPGVSWADASTRATLIRRGPDACMIFEERATLEQLATLRRTALSREPRRNASLDAVLMNDTQKQGWVKDDPRVTAVSNAPAQPTRTKLQ